MQKITTLEELYACSENWAPISQTQLYHYRHVYRTTRNIIPTIAHEISIPREYFGSNSLQTLAYRYYFYPDEKYPYIWAYVNDKDLKADRYTKIKLGRYLKKIAPDCPDNIIADIVAEYNSYGEVAKLHLARTEDEIEHVYRNGPYSCMQNPNAYIHPARAYATEDFAVAYIMRGDERITARALVYMPDKTWFHAYGDVPSLQQSLTLNGFTESGPDFADGGRLKLIYHDNKIVAPYLDGTDTVREEGNYLVIDIRGYDYVATSTNGYLNQFQRECHNCEENVAEVTQDIDGRPICNDCLDLYYYHAIDRYGDYEWVPEQDVIETEDGTFFADEEAAIRNGYNQTDDGEWYTNDELITLDYPEGQIVHEDDATEASDGCWVHDDYIDEYEERLTEDAA